jgi:hypothetical protein
VPCHERERSLAKLLGDKGPVYHLQEYAVSGCEDGTYEYVAWDARGDKLSWIRGEARIVGGVLCLSNITSEGEEQSMETLFEVKCELHQLPKWDKTKYYCVVVGEQAALIKDCDTGELLEHDGEAFRMARKMLKEHGVTLP